MFGHNLHSTTEIRSKRTLTTTLRFTVCACVKDSVGERQRGKGEEGRRGGGEGGVEECGGEEGRRGGGEGGVEECEARGLQVSGRSG